MSGTRQPSENGHSGDTSADAASAPDTLPPARRSLLHEPVGPLDIIGREHFSSVPAAVESCVEPQAVEA